MKRQNQHFQDIGHGQDDSRAGTGRSKRSSATLICDYSEHDLHQLLLNTSEALGFDYAQPGAEREYSQATPKDFGAFGSATASQLHDSSAKQYNLLTRLNDEEENVDFLQMFNQYHHHKQQQEAVLQKPEQMPAAKSSSQSAITPDDAGATHQVQYYQQERSDGNREERIAESYSTTGVQSQTLIGQHSGQRANASTRASAGPQKGAGYLQLPERQPQRQGKHGAIRPGSATVAGQAGRFLANQQSKKRYEQLNQLDNISYSYQQPMPMVNNLLGKSSQAAITYGQVGTQRNSSNAYGIVQQTSLMKPPFGQRRRTRPQSAARNQLQPSKNLQSVTNFTYQKAKQNQNSRAYVPESMKHTDKERLYEEKIELQKQINQMQIANQQLKTQVQSQHAHLRQKDDMIQQVMQQVFVPQSQQVHQSDDQFLQHFQEREINHNLGHKAALLLAKGAAGVKFKAITSAKLTKQSALAAKDGQISSLKLKIKEINEQLMLKEKELADLKQTLKFTKIKEYETELALNVQEAQRLRVLLEREISKPKIDPALVQGLRQQNLQQQQIIQNMQRNSQIQQENYEKLNRKMVVQIKKFAKLKEARKKLAEKSTRNEKKVLILNRKVRQLEQDLQMQQRNQAQQQARSQRPRHASITSQDQQQQHFNDAIQKYNQRFEEQNKIIERLLIIMHDNGIEINEEDLLDDKEPVDDAGESPQPDGPDLTAQRSSLLDLIVTFGGPSENVEGSAQSLLGLTKELKDTDFRTFDDLKDSLRKAFQIDDGAEFTVKHVGDDGAAVELQEEAWQEVKALQMERQENQVQILIELQQNEQEEQNEPEEPSNYEEDDFEEEAPEKVYQAPITLEEVQQHFEELRIILSIKKIQKQHALKFLLRGIKDEQTQKKVKKVTIQSLADGFDKQIRFADSTVSMKLAKFLIEQPNEEGKIELMDDAEFKGQTHAEAVWIKRKDLHVKIDEYLQHYTIYNGLAITSLLSQIQNMFEEIKDDLRQDLEDQDYDEEGTAKIDDIWKSIQICGLYPKNFDPDVKDFILFLAMRHSQSLADVNFKRFMKCFEEDYNILEDGPSRWESDEPYAPSEDEGELESDKPPEPEVQEVIEEMEEAFEELQAEEASKTPMERSSGQILDLEQNELLEKVDEVLMQIVQRLPPTQKIRTLTHLMLPYLTPLYDQEKQRQFLIISQEAFIQFLLGQNKGQLGLQLEESHFVCLLHLLVQEDEDEQNESGSSEQLDTKFILYDEFIELVKTYMKKELIMQQSKSLGIHYDVLGKESVEFLFQLRSSLMYDTSSGGQNNINENSADEDEVDDASDPNFPGRMRSKKQKSVPMQIRDIFHQVIQRKSIQLRRDGKGTQVEVMDFEQMVDVLAVRLGIPTPGPKSQEELKFLMCLDFKYLEMVMLTKLDKIMQDLDYISIDLLRHTQDKDMEHSRQMAISELRRIREEQLGKLKGTHLARLKSNDQGDDKLENDGASQFQGTQPSQVEIQGVSHSTKQEKKRKRPDDKRQNVAKKAGGGRSQAHQWSEQDQIGNSAASVPAENQLAGRAVGRAQFDQDHHSALKSSSAQNSASKERYAPPQALAVSDTEPLQYQISGQDLSSQPMSQSNQPEPQPLRNSASKRRSNMQQDQAIEEEVENMGSGSQIADADFDNIDVNLDVEIQRAERKQAQNKQLAIAAEIVAAANNGSEFDEDNLQDDIPIDDDYDDEDGIISDNYENYAEMKKGQGQLALSPPKTTQIKQEPSSSKPLASALDENAFSMDHSDDLEASPVIRSSLKKAQEEKQLLLPHDQISGPAQKKLKQPPAVGTRPRASGDGMGAARSGRISDERRSSDDNDFAEEQIEDIGDEIEDELDMDDYGEEEEVVEDEVLERMQRTKDDEVQQAHPLPSNKMGGQVGKNDAERKRTTEVNIVDEIIEQYSDNDIAGSDADKVSNDDIPAQVAQGRLNFNKFGKDSSIQQENTHGRLGEEDFDDNVQSSRIEDESPSKAGPAQKYDGNFYDRRAAQGTDDDIVDEEEELINEDLDEAGRSRTENQRTNRSKQFSESIASLKSQKKGGKQQEEAIESEEQYSMEEEVIEEARSLREDNISSQSPQQIAQDTKKPEGRVASSGDKLSDFEFGQDAVRQSNDPQLFEEQSRGGLQRDLAGSRASNKNRAIPALSSQQLGTQSKNARTSQQEKKQEPRGSAANPEKSSDYSGAFDDDYEF